VQHGQDLWDLYGRSLGILPRYPDNSVWFRTSNSALTQSTAGGVIKGTWPHYSAKVALHQQPAAYDTIDQSFPCPKREKLQSDYQTTNEWEAHLSSMSPVVSRIDNVVPGVAASSAWTTNFDHLNDNFQARLCNGYQPPCHNNGNCVSASDVDSVFRAGDWEWNYYWVSNPFAKDYITAVEGLFIGEIVDHISAVAGGKEQTVRFSHTFAHDGDIGPLTGALGIRALRWPGMGANIAIELWNVDSSYFVRVLYCGSPIRSTLGDLSWTPVEQFVAILSSYVPDDMMSFCVS
jgi:acid phosphatase